MLLSIIIPVYKVEKYLDTCVKSVLCQDFSDFEIILIDDGSPDDCPKMCDEWAKKDSRISVIHKENGGLSDARNFGIMAARGEYLLFLDSDDSLVENSLLTIQHTLTINDVDVLIGTFRAKNEGEDTYIINEDSHFPDSSRVYTRDEVADIMRAESSSPCAWRYVVKRKIFEEKEIYFEKGLLNEDARWTPQLICSCEKFVFNPKIFYNYILREGSITTVFNFKKTTDVLQTIELNMKLAEGKSPQLAQYIYSLNASILVYAMREYKFLNASQKKIIMHWFKNHKSINEPLYQANSSLYMCSKLIGGFYTMRLAMFAIRIKSIIMTGKIK